MVFLTHNTIKESQKASNDLFNIIVMLVVILYIIKSKQENYLCLQANQGQKIWCTQTPRGRKSHIRSIESLHETSWQETLFGYLVGLVGLEAAFRIGLALHSVLTSNACA